MEKGDGKNMERKPIKLETGFTGALPGDWFMSREKIHTGRRKLWSMKEYSICLSRMCGAFLSTGNIPGQSSIMPAGICGTGNWFRRLSWLLTG